MAKSPAPHSHDHNIVTHFFPGALLGGVVGIVLGALVVANMANDSLSSYWEQDRFREKREQQIVNEACASPSDLHTAVPEGLSGLPSSTEFSIGEYVIGTVGRLPSDIRPVVVNNRQVVMVAVPDATQAANFPAEAVYVVDLCTRTLEHVLGLSDRTLSVLAITADGSKVAYMFDKNIDATFDMGYIAVMDLRTMNAIEPTSGTERRYNAAEFSFDGKQLSFTAEDTVGTPVAEVWNLETGETESLFDQSPATLVAPWGMGNEAILR